MKKMLSKGKSRTHLLILAMLAPEMLLAALEPLSPVGDVTVPLVPEVQKTVMNLPTLESRIKLLQEDRAKEKVLKHDKTWRKSLRVLYLKDCGVTDAEIEAFRRIMLKD